MKRNNRALLAEDTLRIIEEGGYALPEGRRVELRAAIEAAKAGSRLYDLAVVAQPLPSVRQDTALRVTTETTCAAITRMEREGGGRLGALNFASARNPGGGFLGGAQAQEEALARSSALYPCLLTQGAYYERNRTQTSALYLNLAIYSPGVPFFRDDEGALLAHAAGCDVITAPAPNAGAVRNNSPHEAEKIAPTLKRRAELVLAVAAAERIERLILGAWGCGVFRNDPAMVAATFAELLRGGGRFAGVFREVVFAIYDTTAEQVVLAAFRKQFASETLAQPATEPGNGAP